MKVAHLSDLHFGHHVCREKLQALENDLASRGLDIIVITGDVTDRGTISQFTWAREFLHSLGIPFISVPGNREICATAVWEWMFPRFAMRRYRSFFGSSDRIIHRAVQCETVFFGLNSVHPFPSWPGTIARESRYWLKEQAAHLSGYSKVLFLHHPVLPVPRSSSFWAHSLSDAGEILNICSQTGITLILQGHKHRSSVMEVTLPERDAKVVVSCCGAPLMPRWDSVYHVIDISAKLIEIQTREFVEGTFTEKGRFYFSFQDGAP